MGAGCYYTNTEKGTKAFWVNVEQYYEDEEGNEVFDETAFESVKDQIEDSLMKIGYEVCSVGNETFISNGLFEIFLESTYNGDGIVVRLEPVDFESPLYNLSMANHDRSYQRIIKHFKEEGYSMSIATSGYTSCKL